MVTTEVIINMMNAYNPSGGIDYDVNEPQPAEQRVEVAVAVPLQQVEEVPVQVPGTETVEEMEVEPVLESTSTTEREVNMQGTYVQPVGSVPNVGLTAEETDTDMPELIPQGGDDSDDNTEEEEHDQHPPRCSARIVQGILKPSKYAMASVGTSVLTKEQ
jgi:hypothetical protein